MQRDGGAMVIDGRAGGRKGPVEAVAGVAPAKRAGPERGDRKSVV